MYKVGNIVTMKMERRGHMWIEFYWTAVLIQFAMFTTATNVTTSYPQDVQQVSTEGPFSGSYAWGAWGEWSPCSKTCGGGVSAQKRQCLPRTRITTPDGTLPPPVITVRVTRQLHEDCPGVARRYHQCNTAPCSGNEREARDEQCAAFDRRPFRGRFYTWVPYVDGDSPCTLNCRPLGHHFYASLSLVADGTPCTWPGFRAICVQGSCKVVGRESVLAVAGTRDVRCGRRLVSGLFSRPRLPLGYSYVTTVPPGACRLNVSEIVPSENYIALKISNGSYIMNGEFAVSAPGTYDAAGARFTYSRAFGRDSVFALGPTHYPIDIMILYTQPNPNIRYEYFTESLPGEGETESATRPYLPDSISTAQTKHNRRHHTFNAFSRPSNVPRHPDMVSLSKEVSSAENDVEENVIGGRRFVWKIVSFTQCSRTCGGGIQVGKFRCVESTANGSDREVSPVHCSGSPPAGRRRRCGVATCPPRWRAAAWTACPQCGPANRTRIVGCVQDHSRGITKISDQKCHAARPPTIETCNIPSCNEANSGEVKYIETKRVLSPREHTESFQEGPVYTVTVNSSDLDVGPEYSFSAAAGWLFTEWSECVGWCVGGGVQTRGVRCADPSGCAPRKAPESSRECEPKSPCNPHDGQWFTGVWSPCSSSCGGKQVRGVLCIGGSGRHLRDSACKGPRPDHERECGAECSSTWYFSDWGQCTGNCTIGIGQQRRTVWCAGADNSGASNESECGAQRPLSSKACTPRCSTVSIATLPPDLTIESHRTPGPGYEAPTTQTSTTTESEMKDCEDRLNNCALAVQARLCHYNYYIQNCCFSCKGR